MGQVVQDQQAVEAQIRGEGLREQVPTGGEAAQRPRRAPSPVHVTYALAQAGREPVRQGCARELHLSHLGQPTLRPVVEGRPLKIQRLEELRARGLPVPPLLAVAPGDPTRSPSIDQLLEQGPVIVRGALTGEDGPRTSAAGLSVSIGGCRDADAVARAIEQVRASVDDPAVRHVLGTPEAWALVQREVERASLLVLVVEGDGAYGELHRHGDDPLAQGRTPDWSGALETWRDPARDVVTQLLEQLRPHLPAGPQDLEVVVDGSGAPWLVQARPLLVPLVDGAAFAALRHATEGEGWPVPSTEGLLELDGVHNPEPLSPAHAWLVERLQGPALPRALEVVGMHLYERRGRPRGPRPAPRGSARQALDRLLDELLPRARRQRFELREALDAADATALGRLLGRAVEGCAEILEAHASLGAHRLAGSTWPSSATLWDRAAYLDVLPVRWDIAAPSLAELGSMAPRGRTDARPVDPEAAATLLGEIDDHLFALGLSLVRAWYLRAAALRGLPETDVFRLRPEEVVDLELGAAREVAEARGRLVGRGNALNPPARLWNGRSLPARGGIFQGVGIGPGKTGPVTHRSGLEDLLRRPPDPGQVVVLPALIAQAAVALANTRVAAVVSEHGGATGHGALMARELGITALLGCLGAHTIPEGTEIKVDTRTGRLVPAS